jgi:putative PEP-CTERM system histidine kinase
MTGIVDLWSHALASVLFAALAVWQMRLWNRDRLNRPLAIAFAVTSLWALLSALLGPQHMLSSFTEYGRNFAFLTFMYGIMISATDRERQPAVKLVYGVVGGVIGFQIVLAGVMPEFAGNPVVWSALSFTSHMIGLIAAAGSLVLVHNLYGQAAHDSRWGIRLPMIALAGMWAYDLHLHTVAYLSRDPIIDLYAMRGAILSMLVPLFAWASRRNVEWRMQISRAATFQSLSLMAILIYLILMISASRAIEIVGGDWVRIGQIGLVFAMTLLALVLLPSHKMRAWARVLVAKHFFEHRYDYRQEWLRFTHTVGHAGDDAAPIEERVVKALADVAESPGGLLLLVDETRRFSLGARCSWHRALPALGGGEEALIRFLERKAHVIELAAIRAGSIKSGGEAIPVPDWLVSLENGWAGVPLLHKDRLIGLVVLEHPLVRRPLDWEDFDLFRTAGIQAASYLAEARGQEALAEAQRFEEFNRRFAFILHDIKNLVSQLSLVARNAERHAHNPDFREDMIATLQGSVKKMNDLLLRLDHGRGNVEAEPVRAILVSSAVHAVADIKRRFHPVSVSGDAALTAVADPVRLEQALAHLVQNAIDASPADRPVEIRFGLRRGEVALDVVDHGAGMTADFVQSRLFHPFTSTKEGGFGVGAHEARALVTAMGGRLAVESKVAQGSRFTILLPAGVTQTSARQERICA